MAIIKQYDKRSGITYVYDSKSFYDKEKKCSRAKRTLIGKIDPETGDIIPTDGRNKGAKTAVKTNSSAPEIDKDKRIKELENENQQLMLQVAALKKEIDRLRSK